MQEATHAVTNVVHQAGEAVVHAAESSGHSITHMMMHLILKFKYMIQIGSMLMMCMI